MDCFHYPSPEDNNPVPDSELPAELDWDMWLSNGLSEHDVMNLAGHAEFETTRQFYLAAREDLLQRARAVRAEAMNGNFAEHPIRDLKRD